MMPIFGEQMKSDIISRLIHGEADLETSRYLDRLMELSTLEEAEHQFLIDPFDRSVALVFQLFHSNDLDPWDVDLSNFIKMFNSRIKSAENIDLPTCGKLIRMAWTILRNQASTLIDRQEKTFDDEVEDFWNFEGGWEADLDDIDYNFSLGILSGSADQILPNLFEGRIHREESRPVTIGELLMGLQDAGRLAEEQRTRERIAKERREAHKKARARFSGSLHIEDLEDDLRRTWEALKSKSKNDNQVSLSEISTVLKNQSLNSGIQEDEARAEAQVTALVSSLFLTNRGYISLEQDDEIDGQIRIKDLWSKNNNFEKLTQKLHPKEKLGGFTYE
tara:strand:- start:12 stop:1013 length:1002 start_codon:yes stop_codon:yes gene_type:complete